MEQQTKTTGKTETAGKTAKKPIILVLRLNDAYEVGIALNARIKDGQLTENQKKACNKISDRLSKMINRTEILK